MTTIYLKVDAGKTITIPSVATDAFINFGIYGGGTVIIEGDVTTATLHTADDTTITINGKLNGQRGEIGSKTTILGS